MGSNGAGYSESGASQPCRALVIFGASGDLTRRKLIPALYNLDCAGLLPPGLAIVGFSRSAPDSEGFRRAMRAAVGEFSRRPLTDSGWAGFAGRLHSLSGDYGRAADYAGLQRFVAGLKPAGGPCSCTYYLALPPAAAETVLEQLAGRRRESPGFQARVLAEKPFGSDLESARRLNRLCAAGFREDEIGRIDHYLAKDTVRNLLVLRFGNAVFEELWNRRHIDHVQITAAETLGVGSRAGYYDGCGVVRDMFQNHLLQVLALVAMEPPLAGDLDSVHDHRLEVFKSILPVGPEDFVFGQYRGYRDEPGVARGSRTPTFAALRLEIGNWRWQGVPFYLRSGKALERRLSEVLIRFKSVPLCLLESETACQTARPNTLAIRLHPDEGLRLAFNVRLPGCDNRLEQTGLDFRYAELGVELPEAYERVLLDALRGSPLLFPRAGEVEAAWRVVMPLIEAAERPDAPAVPAYEPGSWGPAEAARLLARDGRAWLAPQAGPKGP
jgi:glucose-6-phosphate 1-dehydrogenase